jgi:AcrR family transcriptional regulator
MLYMRTAIVSAPEDLTARARIVQSALESFAELGYTDATVREIAVRAGVSPALVTHHFGGKAALRAACDAHVEHFIVEKQRAFADHGTMLQAAIGTYGPYLATMLDSPTDAAAGLFSRLFDIAREAVAEGVASERMRPSADPEAQAVALVVLGVAPFLLRRRLAEWSGDGDGILRLAVPLAEIYTHGLMTGEGLLQATIAVEAKVR